ncbi:MAG: peptide chain release factor N(5)-glutamine methyltransferase [Betaproteobacteria bacterium]|nr:peptide chain release factor N(5)-glutamine methyltransferase [Betaproteobacteria bacterium]
MRVRDALQGDPATRGERRLLLEAVLDCSHAWLASHPEALLDEAQDQRYRALVARRAAGEPVAYLVGRREFYGLPLAVTPDVLIPRPETEGLVDWALECLPPGSPAAVLDLGTGSGAIAVALLHERPSLAVTAVDRSPAALTVAAQNAARHHPPGSRPIRFLAGDWYAPVQGERFRLILANPPYVAGGDPHLAQGDLRFEPPAALASGPEGLDDLRRIVAQAPRHLEAGGLLLVEHGHDQGPACAALFAAAGLRQVTLRHDLGGLPRLTGGRYPGPGEQD